MPWDFGGSVEVSARYERGFSESESSAGISLRGEQLVRSPFVKDMQVNLFKKKINDNFSPDRRKRAGFLQVNNDDVGTTVRRLLHPIDVAQGTQIEKEGKKKKEDKRPSHQEWAAAVFKGNARTPYYSGGGR